MTKATGSTVEVESNPVLSGDDENKARREGRLASNYLQQLVLPLAQPIACVCGKSFEIIRRRGRPARFCGDDCRRAEHQRQKNDWARKKVCVEWGPPLDPSVQT